MNRKLLVPIDVTESDLAHNIFTHTQHESRFDTDVIHFLSVVHLSLYYVTLGCRHSINIPSVEELVNDARAKIEKTIRMFELPDVKKVIHVTVGSPKDQILEMARKLSVDLIIISSRRDKLKNTCLDLPQK